jgi:hypothetical protein
MKYVLLFASPTDDTWERLADAERDRIYGEIMSWWAHHSERGTILDGERLASATSATTVRRGGNGSTETVDGPFVESKEEVSGFGVIEVADLDAALELARSWPALQVPGESVEVRPVFAM